MTPLNGSEHTEQFSLKHATFHSSFLFSRATWNTCICLEGHGEECISVQRREKLLQFPIKEFSKCSNTDSENQEKDSGRDYQEQMEIQLCLHIKNKTQYNKITLQNYS